MTTVTKLTSTPRSSIGDRSSATIKYAVKGTADESTARSAVVDEAPSAFQGLVRTTVSLQAEMVDDDVASRSLWRATVRYGTVQRQLDTGESRFSFDTSGGNFQITQSRQTMARYGDYTDYGGAINVERRGEGREPEVAGVDIQVPAFSWTETHYIDDDAINNAYLRTLADMTGSVNNNWFRDFATGEVMFTGATGSIRDQEDWEIQYKFSAQPNRENFSVGSVTVDFKYGWDYMWVEYQMSTGSRNSSGDEVLVKAPVAVYIERVYPFYDFGYLGIGT